MNKVEMDQLTTQRLIDRTNARHVNDDFVFFENYRQIPMFDNPLRLSCLMYAVCTRGHAEITIDAITYNVQKNHILIVGESRMINRFIPHPDFEGLVFMVKPEFLNEVTQGVKEMSNLFVFSRKHPMFELDDYYTRTLFNYGRILKHKMDEPNQNFKRDIVRCILTTMVYDVCNAVFGKMDMSQSPLSRADVLFAQFIKLVELNYIQERRVSWYAEKLEISAKYLSEIVRTASSQTPNEWIDRYVVMEICAQLKNTDKNIKQIAEDLNFPNQSFLGKFFKEHVGSSPSQYRKK